MTVPRLTIRPPSKSGGGRRWSVVAWLRAQRRKAARDLPPVSNQDTREQLETWRRWYGEQTNRALRAEEQLETCHQARREEHLERCREVDRLDEQLEACEADRSSLSQSADHLQEQLEAARAALDAIVNAKSYVSAGGYAVTADEAQALAIKRAADLVSNPASEPKP